MGLKKLHFVRIGLVMALVVFVVMATPFVISYSVQTSRKTQDISRRLLTLWHIETFEGGVKSRISYLERQTINFEKQNKGILFYVNKLTGEQAIAKLSSGERPDLISFGYGVGTQLQPYISASFDNIDMDNKILDCGRLGEEILAVPYMLGGYVKLSSKVSVPMVSNVCPSQLAIDAKREDKSPYELYTSFVKRQIDSFVGTQRDLARINNRVLRGSMNSCEYEYCEEYSDLIQFFAITSECESNIELSKHFVRYVVAEPSQRNLSDIGMYSVNCYPIYTEAPFSDMEKAIHNTKVFANAFDGVTL